MPLRRMNDLVPLARANKMPALQAKYYCACIHATSMAYCKGTCPSRGVQGLLP